MDLDINMKETPSSLGQLEAASMSLEEALAFCLLTREGGPSLFSCVSLLENRERELGVNLSFSWMGREVSLWERDQLDDRRRHSHPTPRA